MFDELRKYVGTGKKVVLERRFPSNPRLNGYVLDVSDYLGVMHCFHDFMPDGYAVFRVGDISDVRSGKYERHWDHMLSSEGLLYGLQRAPSIDLSRMRNAVASISQQCEGMIIECEDEDIEDFYIGKVISIDDEGFEFTHFDGLGKWTTEPSWIDFDEITLIQLETPYLRTFWKYLVKPSQTK